MENVFKGYSSMFIMPGDKVSVENLLKGIIIVSGNDACVALAQGIAGTEEEFVNMMNSMAKKLVCQILNFQILQDYLMKIIIRLRKILQRCQFT